MKTSWKTKSVTTPTKVTGNSSKNTTEVGRWWREATVATMLPSFPEQAPGVHPQPRLQDSWPQ